MLLSVLRSHHNRTLKLLRRAVEALSTMTAIDSLTQTTLTQTTMPQTTQTMMPQKMPTRTPSPTSTTSLDMEKQIQKLDMDKRVHDHAFDSSSSDGENSHGGNGTDKKRRRVTTTSPTPTTRLATTFHPPPSRTLVLPAPEDSWQRSLECHDAKLRHQDALDEEHGDREHHIFNTTLRNRDVCL